MKTINKEKLFSLPEEAFILACRLLELLNPPVSNEENKIFKSFSDARDLLIETIESSPKTIDMQFFNNFVLKNIINSDSNDRTSILKGYIKNNQDELFKFLSREQIIGLLSNSWITGTPKNIDKEVFFNSKTTVAHQELLEMHKNNDSPGKKIDMLIKKYGLVSFHVNSLIDEKNLSILLNNIDYVFDKICQFTSIPPRAIGFNKLCLSIGNKNDDCNGWMIYNENNPSEIVMTQKANISILAHEWLHYFDAEMTARKNKDWLKLRDNITNENFTKNVFDKNLLSHIDFNDFIERFVLNHVKEKYRESFIKDVSVINNLINKEKENPAADVAVIKESFNNLIIKWSGDRKLQNKLGKFAKKLNIGASKFADAFPAEDFLHRYTSFFMADLDIWENYIKNIKQKNKTVFKEHAEIADTHFGHHYAGSTEEMLARSFETFIKRKNTDEGSPVASISTPASLWYPVEEEEKSINKLWDDIFSIISPGLTKEFAPSKISSKLEALREKQKPTLNPVH